MINSYEESFFLNLNRLIIKDFWIFDHILISPYELQFFFVFEFLCPKSICFGSFRWGIIPLDFVNFPIRISKFKNDINYIKYKFSHRFGMVCKWLNMYYSKIKIIYIKKVITMSIWIILNNLIWTCRKCNVCHY